MAKNLPQVISDLKNGKGVFVGSPLFVRDDGSVVDVNEREQFPASALGKAAYDEFEGMSAPSEVTAEAESVSASAISTHNSDVNAHADKESKSNKVTSISETSTDTQYPSAKSVYDSTMRLLISRTIGAEENVSAITWTQDDAGRALALLDARIVINIPANSLANGSTAYCNMRVNGVSSANYFAASEYEATRVYVSLIRNLFSRSITDVYVAGSKMFSTLFYSTRDSAANSSIGQSIGGSLFNVTSISSIYIYLSGITYFPEGTTIEIYGRTA